MAESPEGNQSLAGTAAAGDYVATLCALRDRLAREIDLCVEQPRDVAALSARLTDVLSQIKAVKPAETSVRDELAKKRSQRRGAASRKSDSSDTTGTSGGKQRSV